MRHRRRNNTQTILRKSSTNKTRFISPKKKRSSKPLFYFLLIVILASLFYVYREDVTDFTAQLFTSSGNSGSEQVADVADDDVQQDNESTPSIPAAAEKDPQFYSPIEKKVQLEILNGCGESGVAKKLSGLLKKTKYDIVNSGNYMEQGKVNWEVDETKIISQISDPQSARDLADAMGVLYSNVEQYENPSPIADITIVIGKDYKTLAIFQ